MELPSLKSHLLLFAFIILCLPAWAQLDTATYHLTIKKEMVNNAGKSVMGMTLNGSIPGPTLHFKEGGYAVIYVKNEMDVETSVHWHGILLPNFFDGVPYLTTPPIKPGETLKYEFELRQSGTYWYHSHTMLQEQSGVFGSIVIEPKERTLEYDKELVLMLSDWTNQKPLNVLRNLKRGNEWYNIKKGTATPLNRVIAQGGFGAQLNFWRQRMESADIADIYYNAFLSNGKRVQEYPDFKAGEKVRLRIINGSASSQFWMTFGGEDPLLVSADGKDVIPVKHNKTFIAIAETYDFILTIPEGKKIEVRSMAQDGSGTTSIFIGAGEPLLAKVLPRPNKIEMMKQMAKMDMRMGAPSLKFHPKKDDPYAMKKNWGMKMKEGDMKEMKNMDHPKDESPMQGMDHSKHSDMMMDTTKHEGMNHTMPNKNSMDGMEGMNMKSDEGMEEMNMDSMDKMDGMNMFAEYNYDFLKSPDKTTYSKDLPIKEILLNLTGNMQRYIWSMNGLALSETDNIKIEKGSVTRITLNNLTMMHHPMHLHGHFFRVLNKNGDYSPLKHTVNVPPMQQVTIEFEGTEYGDWFFHCHVLYHMMGGMARVFSYDTPRDPRMKNVPVSKLIHETNRYYTWALADVASHMTSFNAVSSNIRNQFNVNVEYGWNKNIEAEVSYERYLYDYLRVFVGVNTENDRRDDLDLISTTAIAGIRFFTPYMFNLDVRVDNQLRPEIRISRSIMIFPRTSIFGNYEYQMDFGAVNDLSKEGNSNFIGEATWSAGIEYFLNRNFSLMGSYDNRFGAGGGLSVRF
ncbi:MAG: multicopper oxidase domain-containing protein [Cyclobacteriaceae bacterium]|nr:multicopper oxidase domain-containing protein [Cyclobacteriaceae bacterium]